MLNIVLVNLGGPEDLKDLRKYLFNLFSDPFIIDLPAGGLLRPILSRLISRFRSKSSGAKYNLIGGKSPLHEISRAQAAALQKALEEEGVKSKAHIAMRYLEPYIPEVLDSIPAGDEILVIPMYPQYSFSTTESVINVINKHPKAKEVKVIRDFYDHPKYIEAGAKILDDYISITRPKKPHIIFSAHGVPKKMIQKGDPYKKQIEESSKLIWQKLTFQEFKPHVSFQSKTGPAEWTKPYTDELIEELAKDGPHKEILVYPISFTAENLETLYDMDILIKEQVEKLGMKYYRAPAMNDSPYFIELLKNLVLENAKSI